MLTLWHCHCLMAVSAGAKGAPTAHYSTEAPVGRPANSYLHCLTSHCLLGQVSQRDRWEEMGRTKQGGKEQGVDGSSLGRGQLQQQQWLVNPSPILEPNPAQLVQTDLC